MEYDFVHAYHAVMKDKSLILNETEYDYTFVSGFQKENIFGVQYHPEKSHEFGDQLFQNFIDL
jgi:imidazole glycerol-phosphate synthase subunit HisH